MMIEVCTALAYNIKRRNGLQEMWLIGCDTCTTKKPVCLVIGGDHTRMLRRVVDVEQYVIGAPKAGGVPSNGREEVLRLEKATT